MSSAERRHEGNAPIALIDLGDTLCECTVALRAGMALLRRPDENEADELLNPLPPHLEARRRSVMSQPGFWRGLPRRKSGFDLLGILRAERFDLYVVTKGPVDAPHVWSDKVAWCRANLPDVPVVVTDDKARVHGHVIVDDWPPYVDAWQRAWPRGLAILPAQPWNVGADLAANRIRYGNDNREDVVAALRRIRIPQGTAGRRS